MSSLNTLNRSWFILTIIAYIVALLLYGFWNNYYHKKEILENVDTTLYNNAISLKYMLPDDFHDRAIDAQSVSIDEDKYIANKLTNLVREAGFKYAYTIIKKEDKLFFVACDLTADPENERGTFYYYEYEGADESFINAFEKETPTYKTVSDQWGTVRTVMVPEKSPGGINYLACVDYDISYVKGLLNKNLLKSIATVLFFLLLTIPIIKVYTNSYKIFIGNLKESEEKYKSLANNLNVGIFRNTVGSEGEFLEANPAIVKMFGFDSREEFLKLRVTDLYKNPNDRKKYNEKLLKEGALKNEELELLKKDGTSFIGSVSAVAVKNEKNKVKYYDGIIEDIAERKQSEIAILQSEEKYRTVLEANPDPVVVYDIEGRVVYFNPAFTGIFGWRLEECLGKKNDAFVPEKAWPETKKMIDKVLAGEMFSGIETFRYNKKGKIIHVSISGAIYKDQNGNPIGSIINLRDISDLKKMETQLQQAQKMESIGTLAGGIAHDFNNILFPILGYAEMLLMDTPEDSPFKDSLKGIYTSALRAKGLVKQILTFSRQDSSELRLMKMQPIVKEALKLIRSTIPTTIEIKPDINPDCGEIKADPTQIHQLVMNLATNAYHAMEDTGGELKVSLKEMEFGTLDLINPNMAPGVYVCLTVADTGKGMDKNLTDKIFDPFFTTKAIGKGTGMGLSVVHGIVTAMGGAIHVYSEPEKGTQFHVYLPVEKSSPEEQVSHSTTEIQGGTEQVLLVDDEQAILSMEKRMLERLGYQVTSRISSLEALEAFRSNPDKFDLVITDMAMPNMPGDRLSVELTKIRYGIPVLLCTGFSETMSEEKAASLGIKGFLFKPIVMRDLAQKIREVLDECQNIAIQ